jgi:hypothetical protein
MDVTAKTNKLKEIYDDYESNVREFKKGAICKAGCAFCCIHFGHVDVITLEALIIRNRVDGLSDPEPAAIRKKIAKNMKKKVKGSVTKCPFLKADNTCLIYDIRPFSCRQLYSLKECTYRGPTVHRRAVELSKMTVKRLQQLDGTGYSGHISYILHLLDRPSFRKLYTSGGFNPKEIMSFGKKHGIVINRMVSIQ